MLFARRASLASLSFSAAAILFFSAAAWSSAFCFFSDNAAAVFSFFSVRAFFADASVASRWSSAAVSAAVSSAFLFPGRFFAAEFFSS